MKVYLNINKLINVCVLFLAIISGLAIYQSDSTLGNSDLITVIKFLSYVLVFITLSCKRRKIGLPWHLLSFSF